MPVARASFSAGGGRVVCAGDVVSSDDPVLVGRRHLFHDDVEQATAAPGEKRAAVGRTCAGTTAAGEPCQMKAGEGGFCRHHGDD